MSIKTSTRYFFAPIIASLLMMTAGCGSQSGTNASTTVGSGAETGSPAEDGVNGGTQESSPEESLGPQNSTDDTSSRSNGEFVIDAFEKSFSTNNVECSVIDGTTYVYGIASAVSTATLSWEGEDRANPFLVWGLFPGDGNVPFPETLVISVSEDGLSGTFTGDFYLPDISNINRRPFVGTFECGS